MTKNKINDRYEMNTETLHRLSYIMKLVEGLHLYLDDLDRVLRIYLDETRLPLKPVKDKKELGKNIKKRPK